MHAEDAYAAGLFEGEGSITVWRRNGRAFVKLVMRQNDREPLDKLQAILGGTIQGPYVRHGGNEYWQWQICGWQLTERAVERMRPWLSTRRLARWSEVRAERPAPKVYPPDCGRTTPRSMSGYVMHRRRGEDACEACVKARRDYQNARR